METQVEVRRAVVDDTFKSYYVVWKLIFSEISRERLSGLNRTM